MLIQMAERNRKSSMGRGSALAGNGKQDILDIAKQLALW